MDKRKSNLHSKKLKNNSIWRRIGIDPMMSGRMTVFDEQKVIVTLFDRTEIEVIFE